MDRRMNRWARGVAISALGLVAMGATADVEPNAGMLQYPDVSETHIVFVYANDLWTVPRAGGVATPLSSPSGQERFPKFSDDGSTIAFMGNYDGNNDLYTIPTMGGQPERVTHHPAGETLCGWTPEGGLLFYSNGLSGLGRMPRLHTVDANGGLPADLPVPYGTTGAISADGEWLAYTPHTRDSRTWKRYRGGMATDIWLLNLRTHESKKITDWEGTDTLPMWHGKTLYYLSDGGDNHRLNIWSVNVDSGRRQQVTHFSKHDVKWPSIGGDDIVFQNGSDLYLLDTRSRQAKVIEVRIPGDRPTLRPERIDVSRYIQGARISATGKRAVVSARGDIWTLPAENGIPRNLTRSSGVAERDPAWSPDGRWIAYLSDESGEYEVYVTQSDGKGETRQLTSNGGPYKTMYGFTPDSSRILYTDTSTTLRLIDLESGEITEVDTDPWANPQQVSFSHDSRWMAYTRSDDKTSMPSIWLADLESGETHQVTSNMFADNSPVFDRKGDYLYFSTQRIFTPSYSNIDTTFIYENSQVLAAVPLRADVEDPWAIEIDEEEWEDEDEDASDEDADASEEGDDASDDDNGEGDAADAEPVADDGVSGTWEGTVNVPDMGEMEFSLTLTLSGTSVSGSFSSMMFSGDLTGTYDAASGALQMSMSIPDGPSVDWNVVIQNGTMTGTASADGQDVQINATRTGSGGGDGGGDDGGSDEAAEVVEIDIDGFEARAFQLPVPRGNFGQLAVNNKNQLIYARFGSGLKLFDINDDSKAEKSVGSGGGFDVSGDGKKLLIRRGAVGAIQGASAGGSSKNVPTNGMIAMVNPREEWNQMFMDTWRLFRDFFYVDNLHGVDWDAMRDLYQPMVADCANREDLNYVIGELIGELNCGHSYRGGGDTEGASFRGTGMLGVDFVLNNGAYQISKIYGGGVWDLDARGPLSRTDVKVGDYILAVNGVPMDTSKDPWASFIGTTGRTTTLTVSPSASMDDEEARDVVIKPIGGEGGLRYRAWIEKNRAYVEEQTDGRIGYIYVPNTGVDGQNDLFRQFYGQAGKEGLIIDERWNGGGQIPTRFIELLNRPRTNYWKRRNGNSWPWPPDSHQGPKCMLINGLAGSGGDMFPWLFRQAGLGKLIGTRTWGGLVGLSGNPSLIDGGFVGAPTFGFYEKDGTWGVEGHGTDPDIEVVDDPALMVDGGDPQLDAAIKHMLGEIERNGYRPPTPPADPDRSGMGVTEEDK